MKRLGKILFPLFIFILVGHLFSLSVHAQEEKPGIAFIETEQEIHKHQDDFSEDELLVHVANTSLEEVRLEIYVLGIDALTPSLKRASLEPGEVITISFSLENDQIVEEKVYNGFLVFTSQFGDVIYKVVSLDTRPKSGVGETPTEEEVVLLNSNEDIQINWMDLRDNKIRFQVLNTSEFTTTLMGEIYFLKSGIKFESSMEAPGYTVSELKFDLSSFDIEHGRYDGFLLLRGPENSVITQKFTLYFPSVEQQPANGAELDFLYEDESIVIKYYDLQLKNGIFEIGLINKGSAQVTITYAELVVFGLVNVDNEQIEQSILGIQNLNLVIEPYKTDSLEIKLDPQQEDQDSSQIPMDGDYAGYLILQTDLGQPFVVKPITVHVAALDSKFPTYLERISLSLQLWVNEITGARARFGPMEWSIILLLLVLFLTLLFELIRRLRLWWWNFRGRLGPIIVEEIAGKPDLTACLRQHLATSGIVPATAVPNPSTGMAGFMTVVSESKIPEVALVKAILTFLSGYFRTRFGYTITGNLVGDEIKPPVSITIQIKRTQSGKVERIKTIVGETYEQAVKNSAYYVFHYISGRKSALRRIPEWSRFPTHNSYQLYKEANLQKVEQKYSKAIDLYLAAIKEAPFNVLIHLGLGDAYELKKEYIKALNVYLEVVDMWPELYGLWYRIGVNFSFADVWFCDWEDPDYPGDEKNILLYLLKRIFTELGYEKEVKNLTIKELTRERFFRLSVTVWEILEKQFTIRKIARKWAKALSNNLKFLLYQPVEFKPGLPCYYWGYIPFFGWSYGEQFKRLFMIAKYCTLVRSNKYDTKIENEVKNQLDKSWNSNGIYYNAACYYAILSTKVKELQKEEYEVQAIKLIKKAIRDPRTSFSHEWARIDPDLQPLQTNEEFKAIFNIPDKEKLESQETKEIKEKYYALNLVLQGARQQQQLIIKWGKSTISPQELLAGSDHQAGVWKKLLSLAETPEDASLQQVFWNSVMQHTNKIVLMPDKGANSLPNDITLKKLDDCWQAIQKDNRHLPDLWHAHKKDGELFLEHGEKTMSDVWSIWAKAEKRQWEYVEQRIITNFNHLEK